MDRESQKGGERDSRLKTICSRYPAFLQLAPPMSLVEFPKDAGAVVAAISKINVEKSK
jgi:hypothetical protein